MKENLKRKMAKLESIKFAITHACKRNKRVSLLAIQKFSKQRCTLRQKCLQVVTKLKKSRLYNVLKMLKDYAVDHKKKVQQTQKATQQRIKIQKAKCIKILNGYAKSKLSVLCKLKKIHNSKSKKIFDIFHETTKNLRTLQQKYKQIILKHYSILVRKYLTNWHCLTRKQIEEIYDYEIKIQLLKTSKVFHKWSQMIKRKVYVRNILQELTLRKQALILNKIWNGWISLVHDPEKEKNKKAIFFFLERLYSKYIQKLRAHANRKRYQRGIDEYYKLRLMKKTVRGWQNMAKMQAYQKTCIEYRMLNWKNKLLFELLMNADLQKRKKRACAQANQFRIHNLMQSSLRGLKDYAGNAKNIDLKIREAQAKKKRKLMKTILKEWKNIKEQSNSLEICRKAFGDYWKTKKVGHSFGIWRSFRQVERKVEEFRNHNVENIRLNAFNEWRKMIVNKKKQRELIAETRKFYIWSLLGRSMKSMKSRVINQKAKTNCIEAIQKSNGKRMLKLAITSFKINCEYEKNTRTQIHQLQDIHYKRTISHYFNK